MKNITINRASTGIFLLTLITSQSVFSSSSGITGYSGNPATNGGANCSQCHNGGTLPSVNLSGPTSVQPGTISTYTLTISGGQANSGGLDVSTDGGTLMSTLAGTKLQAGEITHTQRATAAGDGTVSWNFDWQAPTTLGAYTIYSAGLSSNGDGGTSSDAVANNTYSVTVSSGAAQSPTAHIQAPMTAGVNTTVSFDGSGSTDPDGTINQYDWNFGDGNTATGALVTNNFTTAGTYTVVLTVTDSDNLTNTTFRDISIGGVMVPVADPGGPYTGTEGLAVNFDASLSTHVTPITNYIWDFGDGTPPVQDVVPTVSHVYATPGAYTVTLAVQDENIITGVAFTTVVISSATGTPPPTPTPSTGETLYADNCASCHQPLASSTKLNRTATQIQDAIGNITQMSSLSSLTIAQVQSIADALVSTTPPPPAPTDGATLYANNCESCHQPLASSTKLNRTATQIQDAIGNINQMAGLSSLTSTEVQAIADALVSTTPPPPAPTDGATLYANNCESCHQPLASSTKLNRTATQIQNAINNNSTMNTLSNLTGLTSAEVQAIADALISTSPPPPAPTDGATLYTNLCASCHQPLASSTKINRTATQIQNAINNNSTMSTLSSLTSLTSTEVQAIADALVAPVPTTGQGLYDAYCLACHGPGGRGGTYEGVTGASASKISSAISKEPLMNSILLNSSQIQAISDYLNGNGGSTTPPPTTTDGATLYTSYCSDCHGALSVSSKLGRSAGQITNAISTYSAMNGLANSLTATQIQAIADALAGGGGGGGGGGTTPTTGEQSYISLCQSCHGIDGTGGSARAIVGVSASQITNAIASVNSMRSIVLSGSTAQDIATFLSSGGGTTPYPTTGEGLYALKCSACHGAGGRGGSEGSVINSSLSKIQKAMQSVSEMRSIPLTNGEAQAIATYLNGDGGGGGEGGGGH